MPLFTGAHRYGVVTEHQTDVAQAVLYTVATFFGTSYVLTRYFPRAARWLVGGEP